MYELALCGLSVYPLSLLRNFHFLNSEQFKDPRSSPLISYACINTKSSNPGKCTLPLLGKRSRELLAAWWELTR
jgi:hypothetical protein